MARPHTSKSPPRLTTATWGGCDGATRRAASRLPRELAHTILFCSRLQRRSCQHKIPLLVSEIQQVCIKRLEYKVHVNVRLCTSLRPYGTKSLLLAELTISRARSYRIFLCYLLWRCIGSPTNISMKGPVELGNSNRKELTDAVPTPSLLRCQCSVNSRKYP